MLMARTRIHSLIRAWDVGMCVSEARVLTLTVIIYIAYIVYMIYMIYVI